MQRIFLSLLAVYIAGGAWVSAQEIPYTLKVDVPLVGVDVSVSDLNGQPRTDLSADDFEIYEDGIRQDIRYFSPVSTAYNILLLFDRSGSTQHQWPLMQRSVAGFISAIRPQDRIAIGAFDNELQIQADWTSDRGKALLALPKLIQLKALGGTDLYAAVERTLRREFRNTNGRRVLVVLTDGRDTSLYTSLVKRNSLPEAERDRLFQKTYKAARDMHIPVYFVAFNTDKNLQPNTIGSDEFRNLQIIFPRSSVPERYLTEVRSRMEKISEVSGGRVLFPKTMEEIVPLYAQIGRELGISYSIGYISPNTAQSGSARRIEVRVRKDNLHVTQSRSEY